MSYYPKTSYQRTEDLRTLYAAAAYVIKQHPKYISRSKLQILVYYAQVQHLTQFGRLIVDSNIYAGKDHPYIKDLDHVLEPGWFLPKRTAVKK